MCFSKCKFAVEHFKHADPKVKSHDRRFFIAINIERRSRGTYTTIRGTKKLHQVGSGRTDGIVFTRGLSCYCCFCIEEKYEQCLNKDIVGSMGKQTFSPNACRIHLDVPRPQDESEDVSNVPIQSEDDKTEEGFQSSVTIWELVTKNSVVAVRPEKLGIYDFLLFHVVSDEPRVLETEEQDECGHLLPIGSKVLSGHYYDFHKEMKTGALCKLNKRLAFIHCDCIIYVEVDPSARKQAYFLPTEVYQDIISDLF